jgi:altronate dehydratase small subunit
MGESDMKAILLGEMDNVATAIDDVPAGSKITIVNGSNELHLIVSELIPFGHKAALHDIPKGSPVVKYNEVIGTAVADIQRGQHVHVHNVVSNRVNAQPRTLPTKEA